jgi:hypothetical protein
VPAAVSEDRLVRAFTWADDDDFVRDFFGEPLFGSPAEARRAWPRARRAMWAQTYRLSLPRPAIVFDHITMDGRDLLWATLDDEAAFSLAAVRDALAADLRRVVGFRRRDSSGAHAISDYLDMWLSDLSAVEALARAVKACTDPLGVRAYYSKMTSAARYGTPLEP